MPLGSLPAPISGCLFYPRPRIVTAAATLDPTDGLILADAGGGYTVTLPPVASLPYNKQYIIIKTDVGVGVLTVDGFSAETINGTATRTLAAQYSRIHIINTGTEWLIISTA